MTSENDRETVSSTLEKSVSLTGKGVVNATDKVVGIVNKIIGIVLGIISIIHGIVGIIYRSVGVTYSVVDNVGHFVEVQGAKKVARKEPERSSELLQWDSQRDRRGSL